MSYPGESAAVTEAKTPRLLDQVRARLRLKHYRLRTERAYAGWIRRFILAHDKRHPRDMVAVGVEGFLGALATREQVAAGTPNQALAALLFLYREVLSIELPWMATMVRAKQPQRVPMALSRDEVSRLLAMLDGRFALMASLLYGSGMRLMECVRLRVKEVDFELNRICVRDGKSGKDRHVPLPQRLREALRAQLERVPMSHQSRIWPRAEVRSGCRMRWHASIRRHRGSRGGDTCFLRVSSRAIRAAASCGVITWTKAGCAARSARGTPPGPYRQARYLSHAAAFLRHPLA